VDFRRPEGVVDRRVVDRLVGGWVGLHERNKNIEGGIGASFSLWWSGPLVGVPVFPSDAHPRQRDALGDDGAQ
jgi:hypothetical protein